MSTGALRAELWRREQAGLGRHRRLRLIDDATLRLELQQRGPRLERAGWFPPIDDRKDPLCTAGLPAPLLEHSRRCCYLIGASATRRAAGDRMQLHHLHYGAANSLCPDEPFWCQPSVVERQGEYVGAFGYSGYLLSPRHILTCWHGWEHFSHDKQVAIFGYQAGSPCDNPTLLPARWVYPLKLYPRATAPNRGNGGPGVGDWVVLELERAVDHMPLRKMPVISAAEPGRPVYTLGFPCGLPLKLADGATVLSANSTELWCDLDTFTGNSGSPVFDAITHALLGIVVQGQKDEGDFEPAARAGCYVGNRIDSRVTGQMAVPATTFATALSRIS
jgi:hypothetical protein